MARIQDGSTADAAENPPARPELVTLDAVVDEMAYPLASRARKWPEFVAQSEFGHLGMLTDCINWTTAEPSSAE